jgi:DNA-binding PadR family transcriptional regulator
LEIHSFWPFGGHHTHTHDHSHPCIAAGGRRRGPPFDGRAGGSFDGRGGNPFGGNPFGGNPFGGFFRHRGRARRGDVRSAILLLLAEQPRNGYQLMQEIEQRSRGHWRPSPGSVYPALQQLEDEGLVRVETTANGKTFHLTELGQEQAKRSQGESLPWDSQSDEEDAASEIGALIRQVVLAASQVARAGTPAQLGEARKLLTDVRRNLYKILASEDTPED